MSDGPITIGKWTSSTLTGWIAAVPLVGALALIGERMGFGGARTFIALGVGAGFAIAQSLSNQGTAVGALRWVWLSAIGAAIPAFIADVARLAPLTDPYALHTSIGAAGLTVGVAQWLHLKQYFTNAATWIPASIVGWGVLALCSGAADLLVRGHRFSGVLGAGAYLGLIALGALALGLITGFVMQRLRPRAR